MMTATLLSLSRSDKLLHRLEDLVHSPEMLIEKMVEMHFEEPMIPLVFLKSPVTARLPVVQNLFTLALPIDLFDPLIAFLFIDPSEIHLGKIVILGHVFLCLIGKITQKVIAGRLSLVTMKFGEVNSGLGLEGEIVIALGSLIH